MMNSYDTIWSYMYLSGVAFAFLDSSFLREQWSSALPLDAH